MRAIFREFPELSNQIAHQAWADLPTPVEALSISPYAWIKRDDLSHQEFGGNKIRKLEFIIADALYRKKNQIITFGATGSNHGVATAMLCRKAGLKCKIYLFDQAITATVQKNLELMHAYGAELIYSKSLAQTVARFYCNPQRLFRNCYFIFAGGSNVLGTLGLVNAAFELKEQIEAGVLPLPEYIFCALGSGSTLAGLTLGVALARLPSKVIGIRVAPSHLGPFAACTKETVTRLIRQSYKMLSSFSHKKLPPVPTPIVWDEYYGAGYGLASKESLKAEQQFAELGLKLEATYSAKAAAAFLDQLKFDPKPSLYWHTYNSRSPMPSRADKSMNKLSRPLQAILEHP